METNNKLREALKRLITEMTANYTDEEEFALWCDISIETIRKAKAALAEPVKNCEIGTAREQAKRFAEYCDSETCKRNRCKFNAKALCIERCALAWAQMPYEEGGDK